MRFLFILCIAAFLFNCSRSHEDIELLENRAKTTASRPSVSSPVITIGPDGATIQTVLSLRSDSSVLSGGDIYWYVNGEIVDSTKGIQFTSNELNKGDVVQALIKKKDREFPSNEIIIKNTPPTILKTNISPPIPRTRSTLHAEATAVDMDGDNVSFNYRWYLNDKFVGEESTLKKELRRDDRIMVKITPYDGEESGNSVTLKTQVFNSSPVITENEPYFDGKIYKYQVVATDPDGDNLAYRLSRAPEAMKIDEQSGLITWDVMSKSNNTYPVEVSITDGHGGEIIYRFGVTMMMESAS